MRPLALLLFPLILLASSCGKAPVKHVQTLPCAWAESSISHELFTEHIRTLTLSAEKELFKDALLVVATRDGGKDAAWTIRKVEPFRPRWDAHPTKGDIQISEWLMLDAAGNATYGVRFLGEYLHGEATGTNVSLREGPAIILGASFAETLRQKAPDPTVRFQKISGLTIEIRHPVSATEIFCGLVK